MWYKLSPWDWIAPVEESADEATAEEDLFEMIEWNLPGWGFSTMDSDFVLVSSVSVHVASFPRSFVFCLDRIHVRTQFMAKG